MSEQAIRTIATRSATSLDVAAFEGGWIWRSARTQGPESAHNVSVPGGLHIGCGLADMETSLPGIARFSARDAAFTLMRLPDEGAVFRTQTRSGPVQSAGIHLPAAALDRADDAICRLIAALDERELRAVTGRSARSLLRLTRPLDPVHGEDARRLLLASRGLEIVALAISVFAPDRVLQTPKRRAPQRHRRIAADVRALLESELASAPALPDLAQRVAASPRVMTEAFRWAYGESIGDYLTRRRMEEGLRVLEAGASVAEAAFRVGYSPNAFSTAFKRYFGESPSALFG